MKLFLLLVFSITFLNLAAQLTDSIGYTMYDLQSNRASMNSIVVNNDSSISACWTFSPDQNASTNPPYLLRGTGYNYWSSATGWVNPPAINTSTGGLRTGFPNIVVTPLGVEMTIQHAAVPNTTFNKIVLNRRTTKGTGNWTTGINPWSNSKNYRSVRACGGLTNENVYVIWVNDTLSKVGNLYFSHSPDGGLTWSAEKTIPNLNGYDGFTPDSYSIDAVGNMIAISIGDMYTDLILLKSYDAGDTWTESIIQKHPFQNYLTCSCGTDYINDGISVDTIRHNSGDSKVLIDADGMCHVWFTAFNYFPGDSFHISYVPIKSDALYYWNENMLPDTTTVWDTYTGGHGAYITIATAEDFNGNGIIDLPTDTFTTCTHYYPYGNYHSGLTMMPSAGIDNYGNIYVCYSTISEIADTTLFHMAHRNIYSKGLQYPYTPPSNWSGAQNIVPSISYGGNGENEECVFASMARKADPNEITVLYQVDSVPGHSLAASGSCEAYYNANKSSTIRVGRFHFLTGIEEKNKNAIFNLFPNPTSDNIYITIVNKFNYPLHIKITDINGKVIKSEQIKFNNSISMNKVSVSLNDLTPGVYACQVTADTFVETQIFIRQ
jgi:hypothetical protein